MNALTTFVRDETGTETVEWAILAALLLLAAGTIWSTIGQNVAAAMTDLSSLLAPAS